MIKKADSRDFYPELTSAKPRGGMQNVSRLVELLIRQYDIRAELQNGSKAAAIAEVKTDRMSQATFAWYEN